MDLISVIVPVYKVEQYLDKCVQSIVDQTYKNLEIILVDDGSPDHCPQMCDAWAQKDSRIRVIHKENGGLSDARNAGLAVAQGQLIGFIDSDDWIAPDFYSRLTQILHETNSGIAACGIEYIQEGAAPSSVCRDSAVQTYDAETALSLLIDDKIRQVVWNKVYRRDVVQSLPFAVGKYHEDEFWSYQAFGLAGRVAVTHAIGYYYLQRGSSIMGAQYTLKRLDAIEAKCLRQPYLQEHFPALAAQGKNNLILTCLYHGQQAQLHLTGTHRKDALAQLRRVIRTHPLDKTSFRQLSRIYRLWYLLMRTSFSMTCKIRNALNIGT